MKRMEVVAKEKMELHEGDEEVKQKREEYAEINEHLNHACDALEKNEEFIAKCSLGMEHFNDAKASYEQAITEIRSKKAELEKWFEEREDKVKGELKHWKDENMGKFSIKELYGETPMKARQDYQECVNSIKIDLPPIKYGED